MSAAPDFLGSEPDPVCVCCDRPLEPLLAVMVSRDLSRRELLKLGLDPNVPTEVVGYCHRGDCHTLLTIIGGP